MKQLMMIGFGAMANEVRTHLPKDLALKWVVVPERSVASVQRQVAADVQVISDIQQCQGQPDYVIEVAGQAAVKEHAEKVLAKGWNLGLISVGTLADTVFFEKLQQVAEKSGAHIHLLAGAIAGIDGIAAAKEGGLEKVTYKGCKSPNSWRGSYAEQLVDLDQVTEATVFYRGTAREAAINFPANANVAATIALAGIGLDETMVELTVDPNISQNKHTIIAEGRFGQMSIEMVGVPLESNPKTSTLAALSVIRACRNSVDAIQI
ncbi:aspartate dehydrogenase [Acinetobacter sichuanensis]|uniref:aspartate dehydrogenase n=1 Tax=Acinetobacter sichuanensis TaxID=2136183 RepID=UPI00280EBCF9|nr:aspartate dehydrogenase [Acinetobacter sichuanensis]MDQ9021234.1 aspartate dehydrogenase [Acinetobacter sichuanensis]